MDFKPNISNYKQKILIFISVLFIALILQPTQTVYASWEDTWAASHVDGIGVGGSGGTDTVPNGVDRHNTGYLCYLLTEDGATLSGAEGNAYAFSSPGYSELPGALMKCTSRRGHTATQFKGTAPWNLTPWTQYGADTNMPQIKAYFEGIDGNTQNGIQFVIDNWGIEAARKFRDNEYIIVIETIMHFQWSEITNGDSNELYSAVWDEVEEYIAKYSESAIILMADNAGYSDIFLRWMQSTGAARTEIFNSVRDTMQLALVDAKMKQLKEQGVGKYTLVGDPVIGTIPNLLDYKASLHISGKALASYTNNVAPLAEYITVGDAGQKAGFVPWTGPTDRNYRFSDADIDAHGVAMFVIKANPDTQTTCDESLQPAPHRPPVESEGTYTIVKNYRTLLEDGTTYQEDGCHSQGDLGSNILIENELEYQVVGWRITNTTNTGISSIDWNPPGSVQGNNGSGTTPTSVTIEPTYTCLYVLLEKVEEEPPEEEPWNYNLTQSQITRRVWFSEPDNPLTNMSGDYKIDTKPFRWIANAHDGCDTHNHEYQGPCSGHKQDCDCSGVCASPCTKKTTDPAHVCTKCTTDHTTWCDDKNNCVENTLYATCGLKEGWKWIDNALTLSINNTLQNTYPYQDVLATKEGWNAETTVKNIIKYFHNGGEVYRKDDMIHKDEQFPQDGSEGETGWDYVCILMRGKDKLTLAQWENVGEGNGIANNANDDLRDASSSGFTVANTDSGTRKTTDYTETFNAYFDLETNEAEGIDNQTEAEAIDEAYDDENNPLGKCSNFSDVELDTPLSINNIKVKIEVYSGSADGGVNDTSCNTSDMITLPSMISGYNTSSGRMVPSGDTISFRPYILMRYDTLEDEKFPAYVLGEYQRQMTPNDYAEITWDKKSSDNLTLVSAQWSTHADAVKDYGVDNVLPGGATLSLNIKTDNRQTVIATTYQCIVTGHGKVQIDNAGGSYGNLTLDNAKSAHQDYISTVKAALEATNVKQYVDDHPDRDDAFGGIEVGPGYDIHELGNTDNNLASIEAKYYFRDYDDGDSANQGDLDVKDNGTDLTTYTFYTCVNGDVHMTINNTEPEMCEGVLARGNAIAQKINQRTMVVDKLEKAVERKKGDDSRAINGPAWYSEAFDGVTVVVQRTTLIVGYNDPPERSSVLDPKLTPRQTSQRTLFDNYFISQFKTKDYSGVYGSGSPLVVGRFKGEYVKMRNMDSLFYSRPFWIPNATTQDLH